MPLAVLAPEEKAKGLESLSPAFKLLLAEHRVPLAIQEVLGHYGISTLEVFAKLEGDEASLRRWIRAGDGLGLDVQGTEGRVWISSLLVVWDACRDRVSRCSASKAERRAMRSRHASQTTSNDEIQTRPSVPWTSRPSPSAARIQRRKDASSPSSFANTSNVEMP